jgi:hypothetical protein
MVVVWGTTLKQSSNRGLSQKENVMLAVMDACLNKMKEEQTVLLGLQKKWVESAVDILMGAQPCAFCEDCWYPFLTLTCLLLLITLQLKLLYHFIISCINFLVNEKCCWRGHIQFAYKEFLKGMSDIFEYDIFQNPMYKTSPNWRFSTNPWQYSF